MAASDNGVDHPSASVDSDARIDKLRAIVRILEESTLASLEYEDEDIEVSLSRYPDGQAVVTHAAPAVAMPAAAPSTAAAPQADSDHHLIKSPFVGTFYRAPSPEADPFVQVGSKVEPQQALCIVEAMKLMNHIESDIGGVIHEILVENGQPVEFGQALFKISVGS